MNQTEASAAIMRLYAVGLDQAAGRRVWPEGLIRLGLDSLLTGVDTPSLRLLAGLGRNEEHEARDLFGAVLDELGLTADIPETQIDALWSLTRLAAAAIVNGNIDPVKGADRIWQDFAKPLEYPPELMPFVSAVVDAYNPDLSSRTRDQITSDIYQAAHDLQTRTE